MTTFGSQNNQWEGSIIMLANKPAQNKKATHPKTCRQTTI